MFQTIKVVGVSGCGKTTLIREFIKKYPQYSHMSFGEFIGLYGTRADKEWDRQLKQYLGIVLIDDHLEWGDRNFVSLYRSEHTLAILLITADINEIISRRRNDRNKVRDLMPHTIENEQRLSIERSYSIAYSLNIPIYKLHTTSINEAIMGLEALLLRVGC